MLYNATKVAYTNFKVLSQFRNYIRNFINSQ